jgi:glucose-1-phosphate thymidylyltransferase
MIDHGAKLRVIDVEGWYDAGKVETLLETNRAMLERGRARKPEQSDNCTIIDPVYIEAGVTMRNSILGPNVSIGKGSTIDGSTLSNTIIETGARVVNSTLTYSLVGSETVVDGVRGTITIGDHSEVHATR